MKKPILVIAFILLCLSAWGQQYANQWDGRNWSLLDDDTKTAMIFGMMLACSGFDTIVEVGKEQGAISDQFYEIAKRSVRTSTLTVKNIISLIDAHYLSNANTVDRIFEVFFLVLEEWKVKNGE
jgi:hypothetical protein